jgi:[FeFe] hydrogenase (group B1/B3)
MKKFDNHVQYIKYSVLKEVVKSELKDNLLNDLLNIPKKIAVGPKPQIRCCIYKERAIVSERIKHILYEFNDHVVNTIELACDECPVNRFSVTEACRGCLAHHCIDNCPVGAITIIDKKANIDHEKCIECGKCYNSCLFDAISDVKRPCHKSCKVDAIKIDPVTKKAIIDYDKCIACGACVLKCPFGAITDKSHILEIVRLIKKSENNTNYKVYCVIAPAIAAQFPQNTIEQVIEALKQLGFYDVIEAAIGADIVAQHETSQLIEELKHKKFITSSCCPAFVSLIRKKYKELEDNISTAVSPMIAAARLIKHTDPNAKIIFIGPCVAKKEEVRYEEYKNDIDFAMSFEELQAFLDAKEIDVSACEEKPLDNASKFGRIFARSGGLTEAVKHVIEDNNYDVELKPVICNGLAECEKALKLAKVGKLDGNFIEGMVCEGGCVNGPLSLNRKPSNTMCINKYAERAKEKSVKDSIRVFDIDEINLDYKK